MLLTAAAGTVADLLVYLDWDSHLLLPFLAKKPIWFSNIPGNSLHFDNLLTTIYGPWPEQNDFNATLARFKKSESILLRGPASPGRFYSFTLYPGKRNVKHTDALPHITSQEMKLVNGWYNVAISPKPVEGYDWVDTSKFPSEYFCVTMRNYCVPVGRTVLLPQVRDLATKELLIDHQKHTQGSHVIERSSKNQFRRFLRVFWFNLAFLIAASFTNSFRDCFYACLLSGFFAILIYLLVRTLAVRKISKMLLQLLAEGKPLETVENTFVKVADRGQGFGPGHVYQCFFYNVSSTHDLEIQAVLPGPNAVYTSILCYDQYCHYINEFRFDETLKSGTDEKEGMKTYRAYLTLSPKYDPNRNEIDVSSLPRGFCIIRLLHPKNEKIQQLCKPVIRLVPRS